MVTCRGLGVGHDGDVIVHLLVGEAFWGLFELFDLVNSVYFGVV